MRRFVNCMPLFALGFAALLHRLESPHLKLHALVGIATLFIIWNLRVNPLFFIGFCQKGLFNVISILEKISEVELDFRVLTF